MFQCLALASQCFIYGFFVEVAVKLQIDGDTGFFIEQRLYILIGNILFERIRELLTFSETS